MYGVSFGHAFAMFRMRFRYVIDMFMIVSLYIKLWVVVVIIQIADAHSAGPGLWTAVMSWRRGS